MINHWIISHYNHGKPLYIYGPVSRVPPPHGMGGYDAPVVVYIHTYLHTYLPTYIPTYIHTYIPLHYITLPYITLPYLTLPYLTFHTYIHTYNTIPYHTIHTYLHTYIPAYIPTYQHTTTTGHRGGGPEEPYHHHRPQGGGPEEPDDTVHPYPLVGGEGGGQRCTIYIYIILYHEIISHCLSIIIMIY